MAVLGRVFQAEGRVNARLRGKNVPRVFKEEKDPKWVKWWDE